MFQINRYKYVDRKKHTKFVVFARTIEYAESLISRVNALGDYCLVKARFGFIKKQYSNIPPYEIEQEQLRTIQEWEEVKNGKKES